MRRLMAVKHRTRAALVVFLALICLLCGCSALVPSDYTVLTPHDAQASTQEQTDVLLVSNYKTLYSALRTLVQNGVEHGILHTSQYSGDVEQDLPQAAYEIAREDPAGAYVIDYITHDCTLIVSYYEIKVDITFRDVLTPLDELEYVGSTAEATRLLSRALENYDDHMTIYATYPDEPDFAALVDTYCRAHIGTHVAKPEFTVTAYPAEGRNRIVELVFTYPATKRELENMQRDVNESLRAAEIYVRYCSSETEKAALLFTYLSERFPYQQGQSATPVYSALCQGLADSESMANSWQLLCDEIGLSCQTVTGMRGGEQYSWNIVTLDDARCHVDVLRDLLEGGALTPRYDEELLGEYYWDQQSVDPCPAPLLEDEPESSEPTAPTEPTEPTEPTDSDAPAEPSQPNSEFANTDLPELPLSPTPNTP